MSKEFSNIGQSNWAINYFSRLLLPLFVGAIFIAIEYWSDLREQNLRRDLTSRGVRASGFVERFEGKEGQVAVFRFRVPDGRDIETSYDMTGTAERDRIAPDAKISVVYDPTSPNQAIPEPFATVPPFDVASDMRWYIFIFGGIWAFFLPLALFSEWRERQRQDSE